MAGYTLLAAVPWNGQEHSHRKARLCAGLFYLILRSDVLMFHSWHQSVCQQLFWDWEKLNLLNKLTFRNILFIGFVKFEIKQWFSACQDQFYAWFSLATLPTKTAQEFFLDHFLKRNGFIFLLPASWTCSMPQQDFLYLNFCSNLSAILKQQREKLCNDDVNHASVL